MGLQINTNVMALNAQHNLGVTATRMSKVLERLSSGLRINRAADDAAGLAVSEKLRTQIRGLSQASRNAQDGISMIQTAEGALNESHAILQRMRELAVQAGTATLLDSDRANIQAEVTQLQGELDRISAVTDFNGLKLLDGSLKGLTVSGAGANLSAANGFVAGGITAYRATTGATWTLSSTAVSGGKSNVTLADGNGNSQTMSVPVPAAGSTVIDFTSLGVKVAVNNNLGSVAVTASNGFTVGMGTGAAQLLVGAGGTDPNEKLMVAINSMSSLALLGGSPNISTQTAAQGMLSTLDSAIALVSTTRATLGSLQNRLEHTISSLSVTVENLTASESRIRDTDVAEETSKMVSAQILSQAGTSVLAQANQAPQSVLALLRGS